MNKTILSARDPQPESVASGGWLPLPELASVELTSEHPDFPVESALDPSAPGPGWRASEPGPQTLVLRFGTPQDLRQIQLVFEGANARTQEFELACGTAADGRILVARQQFNFAPDGATREEENYRRELHGVTELYLHITPDISRGPAPATLRALRVR